MLRKAARARARALIKGTRDASLSVQRRESLGQGVAFWLFFGGTNDCSREGFLLLYCGRARLLVRVDGDWTDFVGVGMSLLYCERLVGMNQVLLLTLFVISENWLWKVHGTILQTYLIIRLALFII